jgi:uncharacterized spore protein YtfJ
MTESRESENQIDQAATNMRLTLDALFGPASPGTVFSDPQTIGEDLVFTAAAWERVGGFGFGVGHGEDPQGGSGAGGGGGGGGGSQGRPVAVIRVGPSGMEVKPVVDFTKIGVTLLLTVVGVWTATRRR